ncbi:MAG: GIY-YIG nuclease family protein, partial [Alphaproteobacteria bacterium]|nr:GIY-YIG nuclease family protein [Alphaproteobacteria bacterium]
FADVLPELRKKGKFILNSVDKKKMQTLTNKIKLYQQELKRTKKQSYGNKTGKGFIYVIKVKTAMDGQQKTCYKIGYTANLEKRLATYRTGNPDLELEYQENLKCNKKQLETVAERYIDMLADFGVPDKVFKDATGVDEILDQAIGYYLNEDEVEEDDEDYGELEF